MSREQWGHGYHAGIKKVLAFKEVRSIFEKNKFAHFVFVKRYGSEGLITENEDLCSLVKMRDGENCGSSCISGSGGSICGGFMGTWGNHAICIFHYPAVDLDAHDPLCKDHHPYHFDD